MADNNQNGSSSGNKNGAGTVSRMQPQDLFDVESDGPKAYISSRTNIELKRPFALPGQTPSTSVSVETMKFDDDSDEDNHQPVFIRPNTNIKSVSVTHNPKPKSAPTLEEAQAKRGELVPVLFEKWQNLRDIVERHEATMQNRWVRKSKAKRRAILLEAWPDMPKEHNGDVALWQRNGNVNGDGINIQNEEVFLMPHMNLEDLCKAEPLPLLLNSRGRHAPDVFNTSDVDRYIFGHYTNNVNKTDLETHEMVFRNYTGPEDYGRLEDIADRPKVARSWLTPKDGMTVHNGLSVLKLQTRICDFLVKCCHLIMRDIPAEELTGKAHPVVEEPPKVSANTASMASLTTTNLEAAYSLPSRMDIKRIEAMIAAQVAQLEDGLWQLRVDPEAWANTVLEGGEHRLERLPDTNGRTHFAMKPEGQGQFWEQVISSILVDRIVGLGVWLVALEKSQGLAWALEKHGVYDLSPTDTLPLEAAVPYFDMRQTLGLTRSGPSSTLKISFPPSPPVRHLFLRNPPVAGQDTSAYVKPLRSETPAEAELLAIMRLLWGEHQGVLQLSTMVDMSEHLVQREPTARTLTTPYIRAQLGEMAVLAECETHLGNFQPWVIRASMLDQHIPKLNGQIKDDFVKRTKWMNPISSMSLGSGFTRLGVPTDGRFQYPATKKQTRENVEAIRAAEAALDRFWDAFLLAYEGTLSQRVLDILVKRERPRTKPFGSESKGSGQVDKAEGKETITVDKRAAKVFDALFFVPGSSGGSETNWGDFLHAMTSAGLAAERIYASLWQFKREGDATAMQIAEPHPSGKMPAVMCRQIGRRLARAYGWERGMFVEAAEEGKK
ncbi:hypothetical protein F5X68DRAFT_212236 [Plectosphaerella plurivora]|uniref:Uncharacterized protein n=1 Tax=Plectosphaerella plurivora TaxID=936078 RepID=A0A9P8V7T7_9PEZI|nr:hypothetical protein F5X68DRAFT_212236 [Plectosphaerella plurivora]